MSKSLAFQKHYSYLQSVVPQLLEYESKVDEIKNSKEWKSAFGYFQTLYNRGGLKERPTKKNGYKIECGTSFVRISEIEDLLTPDQLEEIKKRTI